MRNISEFQIIGHIGSIESREKVAYLDIAANYGRKVDGKWEDDTHWNRVTVFGKNIARLEKIAKGDLIHVRGRVRQNRFERDGETVYSVDLIADGLAVIAKTGKPVEEAGDQAE